MFFRFNFSGTSSRTSCFAISSSSASAVCIARISLMCVIILAHFGEFLTGIGVMSKGPVPTAKPGRFNVAGLSFPKLRSGELVEFEVTIAADQIVMITR